MSSNEFFYLDDDGKKQDAALHGEIGDNDPEYLLSVKEQIKEKYDIDEDLFNLMFFNKAL